MHFYVIFLFLNEIYKTHIHISLSDMKSSLFISDERPMNKFKQEASTSFNEAIYFLPLIHTSQEKVAIHSHVNRRSKSQLCTSKANSIDKEIFCNLHNITARKKKSCLKLPYWPHFLFFLGGGVSFISINTNDAFKVYIKFYTSTNIL